MRVTQDRQRPAFSRAAMFHACDRSDGAGCGDFARREIGRNDSRLAESPAGPLVTWCVGVSGTRSFLPTVVRNAPGACRRRNKPDRFRPPSHCNAASMPVASGFAGAWHRRCVMRWAAAVGQRSNRQEPQTGRRPGKAEAFCEGGGANIKAIRQGRTTSLTGRQYGGANEKQTETQRERRGQQNKTRVSGGATRSEKAGKQSSRDGAAHGRRPAGARSSEEPMVRVSLERRNARAGPGAVFARLRTRLTWKRSSL